MPQVREKKKKDTWHIDTNMRKRDEFIGMYSIPLGFKVRKAIQPSKSSKYNDHEGLGKHAFNIGFFPF
jgi:hypothetical protein